MATRRQFRAQTILSFNAQSRSTVSVDWTLSKGRTMNHRNIGLVLCLAAATISFSSYAGGHRKEARDNRHIGSGMQAVSVGAKGGEYGDGWQYFTDARAGRAVVISPSGDYHYSHGEGLKLVFKATIAA